MSTSQKIPEANRHHGGPGSSHQREDLPDPTEGRGPAPGEPTNGRQSDVSGGGGVRDSHHTHNNRDKG
ncbi:MULTISPECIES: hypothetical protein [unclassified Devosia]|uniref:hypothetical protein n=1 Tax=unclassified Devosia TaxID=196773 RepID=UPI000FDB0A5C|nr:MULTISPECIES: hypothetical protein [unclassified Devosia]